MAKAKKLAFLTVEENRAWEFAFAYYEDEGKSESQAARLAWQDIQAEFPRLRHFDGIADEKQGSINR